MSVLILSSPSNLMAAYRPIVFITTTIGVPPVVYCDVYFGGIYYKTFSKTQPLANGNYLFDIADAAQEYLSSSISPNGGSLVVPKSKSFISCYCMFRGSITDSDGFIVPEANVPIQATSTQIAVSGSGVQSLTFYILNATLQHDNNQDLTAHLNNFKTSNWNATLFPLTHRPANQSMYYGNSDYYPVSNIGTSVITSLRLNYRLKGTTTFLQLTNTPSVPIVVTCIPLAIIGSPSLPDATAGSAYNYSFNLSGDDPFALASIVKPTWLSIAILGSSVVFSGTPTSGDVGTGVSVSFNLTNCGASNTVLFSTSMVINAAVVVTPTGVEITGTTFFNAVNTNRSGSISAPSGCVVTVSITASGPGTSYNLQITITGAAITGNPNITNGTATFTFIMPSSGIVSWSGIFSETSSDGGGSISVS